MRFLTQAAKVLNEQKEHKRRLAVFLCLAAVVALGTVAALRMYGQAMSHKEKRLVCSVAAHQHTPECYNGGETVCGYADYMVHRHNDDCYDAEGSLACHLPEIEGHTHTDSCYGTERVLVCGEEESRPHQHTDGCYIPERGDLQCTIEEHTHGDSCYDGTTGMLVCDIEEHQHDDSCYIWTEALACGQTEGGHQHTAECYTREQRDLQCVGEGHTHGDECYDEDDGLVCEIEEHQHGDDCYIWEEVLTCQQEEGPTGHTHSDGCYEEREVLTCGQLGLHVHDDSCYGEDGSLTCGMLQLEEHVHGEDCFEVVELTDEEVADKFGNDEGSVSGDEAGDVSGDDVGSVSADGAGSVSGDGMESSSDNAADSVSGDETGTVSGDGTGSTSDNKASHVHDESCFDAAGGLMCGYEDVAVEPDIVKVCKKDAYIVTAKYDKEANIPEKAELEAELITAESGGAHYAEREEQIKEALEDDSISMNALMKIGFYVDDVEVEPEDDVIITVQFLDEKGMEDGSPIAIVHFAEGGSEVINGGKAKDRSTTFKTGRFSEFGIVEGYEVREKDLEEKNDGERPVVEEIVQVSETCEYEDDMFRALFRIKGEVRLSADQARRAKIAGDNADVSAEKGLSSDRDGTDMSEDDMDTKGASTENERSDPDGTPEDDGEITEGASGDDITEEEDGGIVSENESGGPAPESDDVTGNEEVVPDGAAEEDTEQSQGLEFRVEPVEKDTKKYADDYAAVIACMDGADKGSDRLMLQVMSYSLTCDGEAVDMSDCEVTVEVIPSQSLRKTANASDKESLEDGGEEEITLSVIQTVENGDAGGTGDKGEKVGRIVNAAPVSGLHSPLAATLDAEGTQGIAAVSAESQANPEFTVEFYANIEQLATEEDPESKDKKSITVIDTSGKRLPTNGGDMPKKKIYLNTDHTVVKTSRLTEVYSPNKYNYIQAPGLVYFNKLAKNKNYKLTEIRVQRKGSTTWENYSCANGKEWHFTNKQKTQEDDPDNFILITADATIRLVHDIETIERRNAASFYDYDITDGKIYKSSDMSQGTYDRNGAKEHDSGDLWYMYTNRQGINGVLSGQTFGFGNSEGTVKTTMGEIVGNRANAENADYGSPTFGLVTGLNNGKLQYASNVKAPNLFNEEGNVNGKTSYVGNLVFDQQGDTYTFTGAEVMENGEIVSQKYGVDKFTRQRDNWNKTYYFAGNDFYPLDTVSSAGKVDLIFGSEPSTGHIKNFSGKDAVLAMPKSDDEKNHNHYFGMHYTIGFDLVKDYVGPLEYLFYGDDDMWVFLDDGKNPAQLICDIGGVHSSVGEYVDLWDYIPKGSEGKYNLSFFYTERGASGSTCWMQFTLPSVSFATTEQDTGKLEIEKKLTGSEDKGQEFGFEIEFKDASGKILMNDYSYTKFQKGTDNVLENDILIWNDAKFTLKADEYIVISFLPEDSTYTIKEVGPVDVEEREPGIDIDWELSDENPYIPIIGGDGQTTTEGTVTGKITKDSTVKILYNNVHKYELPKTGGVGTDICIMVGVVFIMLGTVLVYRKRIVAKRS